MKIPISWLKDYVNINCDTAALADKMTASGSKVEATEHRGAEISNVVVGKITEITPHPNADKLIITRVDIGGDVPIQIVTGATNLTAGDYIPVALAGANLADGLKIKKGKIRGELSDGMLCSVEELGSSRTEFPEAPEDGIYVFDGPRPLGADAMPILGLLDDILEFEITSNRPDCHSVIGIAREAAAVLNGKLKIENGELREEGSGVVRHLIDVEIANARLCPRYVARVVQNVKIGPSPQWMRTRLTAAGMRPVNNIVDITNYVMLEYGQPMHAFDISAIEGGTIIVRNAREDEKIITLDGEVRGLDADMLVIADAKKAVGIAGIIGGEFSKIMDDTTTILLESANFHGPNIRQTAKRLGVRTDSSGKYEKGLDPSLALDCVNRAAALIEQLAAGDVVPGIIDNYPAPRTEGKVPFTTEKINALTGLNLTCAEMDDILARLGIAVQNDVATVPTHRADIQIWQDLAEEVARLHGYDHIPTVVASSANVGKKSAAQKMEERLTDAMVAQGFCQALTFSFESPKVFDKLGLAADSPLRNAVKITNPLGEDTGIMRTTMLNSMLTSLANNYARRNDTAALFEVAKIYHPKESPQDLPEEKKILMIGHYGDVNFFHTKGVVETLARQFGIEEAAMQFVAEKDLPFFHPGRCAKLFVEDTLLAAFGQVHPGLAEAYEIGREAYLAYFYTEALFARANLTPAYVPLARFPEISRDIAVVVKEDVINGDLMTTIRKNGGKHLRNLSLFDVYIGENVPPGTKSMAYNLVFRAEDRTLTDEEAAKTIRKGVAALEDAHGAALRS
ncbi:MAG: phenylalanine--tRNA ligase subunit beta [Clostridiales bacterium]|jgi:phenylalanyl-tRNA synthetase beta chain|nr:phenylalanine--tRNA ligase subunit beta [Clostridiales bacterium]